MSAPLVTVIVPIFNQAEFVVDTVESVTRQTYPALQIIVVDDGSTDGGADVLEARFGSSITLLRQTNSGPSNAVNLGFANARGTYVALLGGDDVCVPDRIAIQVEVMSATHNDIIHSKPFLIDEKGEGILDSEFPVFFQERAGNTSLRILMLEGNFICASSAIMRRAVLDKIGTFRAGLVQLQDYDYWLRAAAAGLSIAEHQPRIVKYRRHLTNLSSTKANFASIAEAIPVIKSALETGDPSTLRRAFPYLFEPTIDASSPLTALDKTLLLLAHPRAEIRMAGAENLIALFDDPAFAIKAAEVGLSLPRFAQNALSH